MNHFENELGEAHINLSGLKLWIHGYQYQNPDEYWDANWLNATAVCSANGASVRVHGAFIRTDEIAAWQSAVETLTVNFQGVAELQCIEPEISVTLKAMSLGALEMKVQITPDHLNQEHRFTFAIDQSYLTSLASQCARLLQSFPIRSGRLA